MKSQEKRELSQNKTMGMFNSKILICVISAILCIAIVAVICVGTVNGIKYLERENDAAQKEISTLKSNLALSNAEIESAKSNQAQMSDEINSLNAMLETLKQNLNSVESANKSAQKEIDSLKDSNKAAMEEIESLKERLAALSEEKIRIYIDQGHNPTSYHNTGATGNGLYEQDVTFKIGCLLADLLRSDGRFEVCLSRPNKSVVLGTDNNSSFKARVDGAIAFNADYFISLHVNSFTQSDANGLEVYVAEEGTESYIFGSSLLQGLADSTGLKNRGMKLNPKLYVLANATMPATLLEMGFISNSGDAALMSEHPEIFAEGIYNGILDFFGLK